MSFDPSETYIHLDSEGSATSFVGGDTFWSRTESELERLGQGWLVSEFYCTSDWSSWEMHPKADEFVYLLSGSASMLLETAEGIKNVALNRRAAVIVPKRIWHTARVSEPSRMLFVTMGGGTQHRPAQ